MATESKKKEVLKLHIGSVALHDAGHKIGALKPIEPKSLKDEKIYPTLYVSTKDVPGLKGKEAGDYVTLVVRACIRSRSLSERKGGEANENFSLDLESIGVVSGKTEN